MANFQVYPTNLANPGRIGTIRMTLNIIFVLIIITHAQGFESIKIFGGEGDLAAPYCLQTLNTFTSTVQVFCTNVNIIQVSLIMFRKISILVMGMLSRSNI